MNLFIGNFSINESAGENDFILGDTVKIEVTFSDISQTFEITKMEVDGTEVMSTGPETNLILNHPYGDWFEIEWHFTGDPGAAELTLVLTSHDLEAEPSNAAKVFTSEFDNLAGGEGVDITLAEDYGIDDDEQVEIRPEGSSGQTAALLLTTQTRSRATQTQTSGHEPLEEAATELEAPLLEGAKLIILPRRKKGQSTEDGTADEGPWLSILP